MHRANDPLWLTFFGRPAFVWSTGDETPFSSRYRKGIGLLAWLAGQADRPVRRRAAADLFWPELDEAAARANLRVVLSDLVRQFAAVELADALEVDREWIVLRAGDRLVTDDMLAHDAASSPFAPAFARRSVLPWCEVEGLDESGDFGDWLAARRAWFAARLGAADDAGSGIGQAAVGGGPDAAVAATGAHWQRLAVLRVALDEEEADDERTALAQWKARFARLSEALRLFGARPVSGDMEGASFVLGLDARGGLRRQALRAALACLDALPAARVGLCVGHLFVQGEGTAFQGRRLGLAARLALCAEPGEIAADAGFADLVAGCAPRAEIRRFRGRLAETPVLILDPRELRRALRAPAVPETPFLGREADLARLQALLSPGTKVALVGPPGVGKTRLAQEFARPWRDARVFWLFCRAEIAREPWAALVEMLAREDLHVLSAHEAEAVRRAIGHRHVGFAQRGALIAALARLFAAALVVVDDAQWLDDAGAGLLDEVARKTSACWLLTRRPQEGGWQPPDATDHVLPPLDDRTAEELLIALSGGDLAAQSLRNARVRGRGLPLFLIAEARARCAHIDDVVTGLCNLPAGQGDALAIAALLGQQFLREDLVALAGEQAAQVALAAAMAEGIAFAYHRDQWGFAHPLLRETCLARLDPADRVTLAQSAARRFLARGETARAAEFFEQAQDAPGARQAWLAAAQAALAEEDASAACALFGRLAQLGYPPGEVGDWARIHHARALIVRDGYGIDAIPTLCRPVADAYRDATDDQGRELRFSAEALIYLWSGGEAGTAGLAHAKRLMELADTPQRQYAAFWARAKAHFFHGDFAQARQDYETVLASALTLPERMRYLPTDPLAFVSASYAWVLWSLADGHWRERIDRHVAETENASSPQNACVAHWFAAAVHLCAGERAGLALHASKAFEIAQTEAFGFWEAYALLLVQIVRALDGAAPEATTCEALEAAAQRAYPAGINTVRWLLAEAWVAARRWDEACALTTRALAVARASEHQYCLPDLHRLHAAALAGLGCKVEAAEAMCTACQLAKEKGYAGWLARWEGCAPDRVAAQWEQARVAQDARIMA
jgi:hypothetical protein